MGVGSLRSNVRLRVQVESVWGFPYIGGMDPILPKKDPDVC